MMKSLLLTLPILVSLTAAVPSGTANAGDASPAFNGKYRGAMTLSPNGLSSAYGSPACDDQRPAVMSIRRGAVYMSYRDWQRNLIHYRGSVNGGGQVSAYHRNGDGTLSAMTGTISGNQLTANMQRGLCSYTVTLTKM
jgi:hypothetical protein